jgi:hypothetical protein
MINHSFLMILMFIIVFISGASSCINEEVDTKTENNAPMSTEKIKITVNSKTYTATLFDNNSAIAFKELLPMTIEMTELNGNEKYYDLPNRLPTNSSNPGTIKNGDLMLYGSKTLVVFYKTFSTSYNYTKLGYIDDASGLAAALGTGNVTVIFESE